MAIKTDVVCLLYMIVCFFPLQWSYTFCGHFMHVALAHGSFIVYDASMFLTSPMDVRPLVCYRTLARHAYAIYHHTTFSSPPPSDSPFFTHPEPPPPAGSWRLLRKNLTKLLLHKMAQWGKGQVNNQPSTN